MLLCIESALQEFQDKEDLLEIVFNFCLLLENGMFQILYVKIFSRSIRTFDNGIRTMSAPYLCYLKALQARELLRGHFSKTCVHINFATSYSFHVREV